MRRVCSLIIGLYVLASAVAKADDGSIVEGIGGSVHLVKPEHASIRMVRERVDVIINGDKADVRCEFVFRNEGPGVTTTMGFPDMTYFNSDLDGAAPEKSAMRYFRSWVDGKEVQVRYVRDRFIRTPDPYLFNGWHIKDVHFGGGQMRRVVDHFGTTTGYYSQGDWYTFQYILTTGASWKGKIGSAVVNIDIRRWPSINNRKYKLNSASPGYSRRGNKLRWVLKNFEPEADIFATFRPRAWVTGLGLEDDSQTSYRVDSGVIMANLGSCSRITLVKHPKQGLCRVVYGEQRLKLFQGSRWAVLNGSRRIPLPEAPIFETRGTEQRG